MMKLQFLNTPHSLMTRFYMEKIASAFCSTSYGIKLLLTLITHEKNSNNQHKLTMPSDRFP